MHRKEFEENIRAKLKELEAEVERLKAQLQAMEKEPRSQHEEHFEQIHDMKERAKQTLDELEQADDNNFKPLKAKLEDYWSSLGREIKAYDRKLNN